MATVDQYTMTNPVTQYTSEDFREQQQSGPRLDADLAVKADHGERTYRGSGRLAGRKALLAPENIADERFARSLITTTVLELGGIDLIANVAGRQQLVENLADLTGGSFEKTFHANVNSLFRVIQEALPHQHHVQGAGAAAGTAGDPGECRCTGPYLDTAANCRWPAREALKEFGRQTPLGRAGQPAELAPACVILASQEPGYVTGETVNVNGGMPTP